MEAAGRREAALRRRGICTHGYVKGQPYGADGPVTCHDCGATFPTDAAWWAARQEARAS